MIKKNILFFRISESSFINNDIEILRSRHNVTVYDFKMEKGIGLISSLQNQFSFIRNSGDKFDTFFIWFADYHSLLPTFLKRNRKLVTVAGGYDADEILTGLEKGTKSRLRKAIVKYTFGKSDAVPAVSECIRSYLEKAGIVKNVSVIFNGVNIRQYGSAKIGTKKNLVLTTGGTASLKELNRKRLDFFIQLANNYNREFPELPARFVLTGHEPGSETFNYLKPLIKSPGIEILPRISDKELSSLYAEASVYLQPSLYEGFGIAIAEAMLNGCVVIANKAGSIPEVVGDAGILLSGFSEQEYADHIRKTLEGNNNNLRQLARERILSSYTLERRKNELLKLIASL